MTKIFNYFSLKREKTLELTKSFTFPIYITFFFGKVLVEFVKWSHRFIN
jgi:hypothetical protein